MQRLLDILFSVSALIILSPLFLPIAVVLRLTGEGEIFFKQEGVGRGGEGEHGRRHHDAADDQRERNGASAHGRADVKRKVHGNEGMIRVQLGKWWWPSWCDGMTSL